MNNKARNELKQYLTKHTKCTTQAGWPCATCTMDLFKRLGLNPENEQYKQHNEPTDRLNEVWRAIIQIRGD